MSEFKLKKGSIADLHRIYGKYMRADFHRYERMPEPVIALAMARGKQELLLITDDSGRLAGYAICCCRSVYGYVLINYLAVLQQRRGEGIGSAALELLSGYYADRMGLIVELTDTPGEREETLRRHSFYGRAGFADADSDYRLCGVQTYLMVRPLRAAADISAAAHLILPEIYSHSLPKRAVRAIVDIRPADVGTESIFDTEEQR